MCTTTPGHMLKLTSGMNVMVSLNYFLLSCAVLTVEPRAVHVLRECSMAELPLGSLRVFFKTKLALYFHHKDYRLLGCWFGGLE